MSSLLGSLDTELNFWDANPNFTSISLYKTFKQKDKSKKKEDSSRIMWAIALFADKHPENVWKNENEETKKDMLASDVIGNPKFNWDDVQDLVNMYKDKVLTIPEKDLVNFEIKMHERQRFIDSTPFSLDSFSDSGKLVKGTATQLDKMLTETGKVYTQYEELKAKFDKSEEEGHVRGGRTESASEDGTI